MKNLPYNRAGRMGEMLYERVAEVLRNDITDPRLKGVSVTRVLMTPDLRLARVLFHMDTPDEKQVRDARKGFISARGFIKRKIGEAVELKFIPELEFHYDQAVDTRSRIDDLLAGVTKASE